MSNLPQRSSNDQQQRRSRLHKMLIHRKRHIQTNRNITTHTLAIRTRTKRPLAQTIRRARHKIHSLQIPAPLQNTRFPTTLGYVQSNITNVVVSWGILSRSKLKLYATVNFLFTIAIRRSHPPTRCVPVIKRGHAKATKRT